MLVFVTVNLSSGQVKSSISKDAFTSLSNAITTDVESEHTPLLTNKLTLFVLDAEAIKDVVGVYTGWKIIDVPFPIIYIMSSIM